MSVNKYGGSTQRSFVRAEYRWNPASIQRQLLLITPPHYSPPLAFLLLGVSQSVQCLSRVTELACYIVTH